MSTVLTDNMENEPDNQDNNDEWVFSSWGDYNFYEDVDFQEAFELYITNKETSGENAAFLLDMYRLQDKANNNLLTKSDVQYIVELYIKKSSPFEININSKSILDEFSKIDTDKIELDANVSSLFKKPFKAAISEVHALVERDSLPRFLKKGSLEGGRVEKDEFLSLAEAGESMEIEKISQGERSKVIEARERRSDPQKREDAIKSAIEYRMKAEEDIKRKNEQKIKDNAIKELAKAEEEKLKTIKPEKLREENRMLAAGNLELIMEQEKLLKAINLQELKCIESSTVIMDRSSNLSKLRIECITCTEDLQPELLKKINRCNEFHNKRFETIEFLQEKIDTLSKIPNNERSSKYAGLIKSIMQLQKDCAMSLAKIEDNVVLFGKAMQAMQSRTESIIKEYQLIYPGLGAIEEQRKYLEANKEYIEEKDYNAIRKNLDKLSKEYLKSDKKQQEELDVVIEAYRKEMEELIKTKPKTVDVSAFEWKFSAIGIDLDINKKSHEPMVEAYMTFLESEYSEENLKFLLLIKKWNEEGNVSVKEIKEMIQEYIMEGGFIPGQKNESKIGSKQINVSDKTREEILECFNEYEKTKKPEFLIKALNKLQNAIGDVEQLSQKDSFRRFVKTPEFVQAKKDVDELEKIIQERAKKEEAEESRAGAMAQEEADRNRKLFSTKKAVITREIKQQEDKRELELLSKATPAFMKKNHPEKIYTIQNLTFLKEQRNLLNEGLKMSLIPQEKQDEALLKQLQRAESELNKIEGFCRKELSEERQKEFAPFIKKYQEKYASLFIKAVEHIASVTVKPGVSMPENNPFPTMEGEDKNTLDALKVHISEVDFAVETRARSVSIRGGVPPMEPRGQPSFSFMQSKGESLASLVVKQPPVADTPLEEVKSDDARIIPIKNK